MRTPVNALMNGLAAVFSCAGPRRIGRNERAVGQINVEMRVFALQGERSPQGGRLEAPEGILLPDPARIDRVVSQVKIGATLRVLE